jgi:hypothetical protein
LRPRRVAAAEGLVKVRPAGSVADVDPLDEGLSARRCRHRAKERDKSQQFHDDVFHGCSAMSRNSRSHSIASSAGNRSEVGIVGLIYQGLRWG